MKLRNTLIKMFSLVFAACAAFAIATMPTAKTVNAQEASFKVKDTSIFVYDGEDEGKVGLKFEAEFNTAWLTANPAEKYTFGMIVAPTAKFTAWDGEATPTANMEAVDGVNIIRIQNSPLSAGATFGASILFDDESLKATIAEKLEIEVSDVTPEQLASLKEEVYVQSYSAVAYATFGEEIVYLDKIDATMRDTAAKTYALGVAEDDANYKAIALAYLGLTESDVYTQSAYVLASDKKVVVETAESYEAKDTTMIVAGGKILALGTDYTIDNGSIILAETKEIGTVETVVVIDDTMLNVVEVSYLDVITKEVEEVDYDASTGILYSTAWNGEKINKITIKDEVLTTEENGGLVVDGEDNIVGIRAKVNASDENPGITYKTTTNSSNVINYKGDIKVYTDGKVYAINNVNYYTKLIFNATDLKNAVGYNVDYSIADLGAEDVETEREQTLNGKGYFVATTLSSSKYYEGVYNVGIYKMMADVDMEKTGIGYVNNPLTMGSKIGGFLGSFDGNGYTIDNYKADQQGLFGRMSNNISGNEVHTGKNNRYVSYEATIKNFALTDVITTYWDEETQRETPILALTAGADAFVAPYGNITISNIYATVSPESTALGNFITQIGIKSSINNLYLVNTNEFGMEAQDNNKFRLTDDASRASATIASDAKIYNLFTNYGKSYSTIQTYNSFEGVLFGHAYTSVSSVPAHAYEGMQEAVDSITNTYVVTTMPINYTTYGYPFGYTYSSNYLCIQNKVVGEGESATAEVVLPKADLYKLGRLGPSAKARMAIAYATNETVGTIPVMYGIKQSAIDDVKAIYAATGAVPASNSNTAFMCDTCGEIAFNYTGYRTVKAGDACCYTYSDVACTGKFIATSTYKVPGSVGQYNTPAMFTFTYHTAADMGEYYSDSNGAWKLKGVYKYANNEAMKNAVNDYSSFTGAAGNGLWEVVETKDGEDNVIARELKWVGRAA